MILPHQVYAVEEDRLVTIELETKQAHKRRKI